MKKISVISRSYGYGRKLFDLEKENQQLKDRINKAVEFLNLYAGYDNNYCLDYHEIGKLVEILIR